MTKIKIISLWQPWAWAMWESLKKYETRSERFIEISGLRGYKGMLGIHAAKKPFSMYDYAPEFTRTILSSFYNGRPLEEFCRELKYGVLGGICDLGNIYATGIISKNLHESELFWGDYTPGRRAIHCHDMVKLPTPIPMRGYQGAWNWELPDGLLPHPSVSRGDTELYGQATPKDDGRIDGA